MIGHRPLASFVPWIAIALLTGGGLAGCDRIVEPERTASARPLHAGTATEAPAVGGRFTLLTYNVAGLPQGISSSKPEQNNPRIGPLLNAYDLVLVQEDFVYHAELSGEVEHPYRSTPLVEHPSLVNIGDGLNRFSRFPLGELVRVEWTACNGLLFDASDCSSSKGFSVATVTLGDNHPPLTVVNLHMDAGRSPADAQARADQVEQLLAWLDEHVSPHDALVIAGDTNLQSDEPLDAPILARLIEGTATADLCDELHGPDAPDGFCRGSRRIDRVLVRSGDDLELEARSFYEPTEFVDDDAVDLSDHKPVAVELDWRPRARVFAAHP